jgi:hypothetical protein
MHKKHAAYISICIAVGLVAALLRIIYSFFPFSPVSDLIVFGVLGGVLCYFRPDRYWLWILLITAPTMLYVVSRVIKLGPESLSQGIGTFWATSLVLIPLAAVVSGFLGQKLGSRKVG